MSKAQELFQQAFDQPRTPRSDAWFAGADEGLLIYRKHVADERQVTANA